MSPSSDASFVCENTNEGAETNASSARSRRIAAALAVSGSAGHAFLLTGAGWHAHESASRSSGRASRRASSSSARSLRAKSAKGATASAAAARRRDSAAGAHDDVCDFEELFKLENE